MKLSTRFSSWFVILFFVLSLQVSAQWSTNPAVNNAISPFDFHQQRPKIASDGSGGAIITWEDHRNGSKIYAQRINASGVVQWTTDGVAIFTAPGDQWAPQIISDGSGGAIITCYDTRNDATTGYDIYAQKINSSGVIQWSAGGVVISTAANTQGLPQLVSDGSGGAIITWQDFRNDATTGSDIYAQKINTSGVVQWTPNGVAISIVIGSQFNQKIISDGSGGAIIVWQDSRNFATTGVDIYALKIDASGVSSLPINGDAISTAAGTQSSPQLVSDGSGGAIIVWQDDRNSATTLTDIYAQRAYGKAAQWTYNGIAISTVPDYQASPTIVSDGSGGAIIAWQDHRNFAATSADIYAQKITGDGFVEWAIDGNAVSTASGSQTSPTIVGDGIGGAIIMWEDFRNFATNGVDLYAQKINASGVVQWTPDGVIISNAPSHQQSPTIIGDGSGGAIIAWYDDRSGTNTLIYAQRINSPGSVQWTANGVAISTAGVIQSFPKIVDDGSGGAIIAWQDLRNADYDIYAQKIDKYGVFGQATPKLIAAKDIANDQGGRLRLFWNPSYLDAEAYQIVKSYTILLGAKTTGILGKSSGTQGSGIYWQEAAFIPAKWLEGYTTVIPTFADSGLQGIPMYYFQVIAQNSDSTQMWFSNIDSGYSVDNIPPVGLGNAVIASNGGLVFLKWNKDRVDKDLMEYRIYRSTTPGFAIGPATKIKATTDTTYTDSTGTSGGTYYYRIAAVDVHGNIGAPSAELNQKVLAVQGTRSIAPKEFVLAQNYPNPFNPTTTIEFTVPSNGRATLKIFNTLGEEVAILFNGEAEAGRYHQVQFNASNFSSGIYFARLQSGEKIQLKKMMLIK